MEEKKLTEQESLNLITEMIAKAKGNIHERGISAIMWGSVVAVAGFTDAAESYWHFYIGFDIWLIVLAAIIPQIFLSIHEAKHREKVLTYQQSFLNAIWMVYGISIFALMFYLNVIPHVVNNNYADDGVELMVRNIHTGVISHIASRVPSFPSLLLILFGIPTLITGLACKLKPMLIGGILCYVFFIISCFTSFTGDMLLCGLAGVFNWLIPGIILHNKYLKGQAC